MRVPTGGKAREPKGMIRSDSGADSIVWMKEANTLIGRKMPWNDEFQGFLRVSARTPEEFFSGVFLQENEMTDQEYMNRAIELALKGTGFVNPNPLVGAVIVKNGRIIGEGYHEQYGKLHAERNALSSCKEDPRDATMYVTLEPCCHYGKNPPCTDAILERGIKRVFIGSRDPNPLVAGKGTRILQDAGLDVITDFMREECDSINQAFFYFITTERPYVTLKYAMTLDGRIAAKTGRSRWISGETSRAHTHHQRGANMGIMVGSGTVLKDDPLLTSRDTGLPSPVRIICDTRLRTPITSNLVQTAKDTGPLLRMPRTILATSVNDDKLLAPYRDAGVHVLTLPEGQDGHIDLAELMKELGKLKIDSVICEGGGHLNGSVLASGTASFAQVYIAPKIFGGTPAFCPVLGPGTDDPSGAWHLTDTKITSLGDDYLIEGKVTSCSQESLKK